MKSELTDTLNRHGRQASVYAAIGVFALIVELSLFYLISEKTGLGIIVANTIAVGTGMIVAFALNASLNFKVSDSLLARFIAYACVVALGYLLGTGILLVLTAAGIAAIIAKIVSLPFVFLLQYGLNQRFAFGAK